ncbi:MAG: hypothetical protein J6D57_09145 [Mogibacterium sp.]|nr:hypothetical protein [Mogibacterium sp.]
MAKSKYSPEERLKIGKKMYERELTRFTAAAKYDISPDTARNYMRFYKAVLAESGREDN